MAIQNISTLLSTLAQRVAGLQKYGPQLGSQIPIEGQSYTLDQLVAVYQAGINDRTQVAAAKGALQLLLTQTNKDNAVREAIDDAVKAALTAKFGSNSQELIACGYVKAAKKPTVEVKVNAVAQAANTRKVRHTMGKLQKKSLKGQAPQATPIPAEATAAPPPVPPGTTPTKP